MILSRPYALAGGLGPDDGRTLVVHEFSHQLHMLNGRSANRFPPMPSDSAAGRWSQTMQSAYRQLLADCQRGRPALLDC